MKKFSLALDLKDDEQLIKEYEEYHQQVWPEIIRRIKESGIVNMEIYRYRNRLFMIMITRDDFSFDKKALADREHEKVQEWEELMWTYQQPMPGALPGEKWMLMDKIFEL